MVREVVFSWGVVVVINKVVVRVVVMVRDVIVA